jgi:hypothetical protein
VFHPANAVASAATTRWQVVHVVACAMCFFGLLGLAGIYVRQAARAGWTGLVGFLMLSFWLVAIMGFSFVEAFILPHVVTASPSLVDAWMKVFNGGTSKIDLGVLPTLWTLVGVVYILGGLLFGVATFRAGILPRGAAVLLALGTLLAPLGGLLPLASQPKVAIPAGLALAWMGYGLWSEQRTPASQRETATDTKSSGKVAASGHSHM